ncbi:imidazole glycerol phosphate synthase subunit HisH [Aliiglaciecola sp. CAU 1673]|uniref:imidazole glycerol phosphate synthase subunit HisH n=1 Tax=Aliiglaciecola sp. CAU 1673 TaxID=3032595 RepID=UPI0023DB3CDD|nr:imidazole glycerol phosphate synthase subunit HisH [Aliiglaciecola sp. CAU 1673]MDF2179540.1 imidazole glycerol phosphate synthase subunit HisH [Aliiglaciecola sp. CAU 1673]
MELVIINTGCANIASVAFAIERLGMKVRVSDQPNEIESADKLFLPGVGAAASAMQSIREKGLDTLLPGLTQPVLGICLGMQLMGRHSEEGNANCLGMIEADTKRMRAEGLRLPHMGWNTVQFPRQSALFEGIDAGTYFYFVHGFAMALGDYTLASCDYGQPFSAAIGKDNFYGVQFHPERSGAAGARLLHNFIHNL